MRITQVKKRPKENVLTNYSSVGDENDGGVYWVRPQTSVLHCRHLPDDDDEDDDGDDNDDDDYDDDDDDNDDDNDDDDENEDDAGHE